MIQGLLTKLSANNLSKQALKQGDLEHLLTNIRAPGKYKIRDISAMGGPDTIFFL